MSIHTLLQVVVSLKLWHSGVTLISGYKPIKTSGSSTDGLYTRKIEPSNMAYRLSYTIDCLKKHDRRARRVQNAKREASVNPGLLLLLEVQLLQCGYDRKKLHWNYRKVHAAFARTRGNGGNFNITQAACRRAAIMSLSDFASSDFPLFSNLPTA
ncbi:hypothetical protein D6C81_09186 [Aureobasidium pullulans]|nr:hypothetical protein D6C81_09186 [Aureobasidium pullulans]